MMQKTGKITRSYKALKVELEARPGATLVIGAVDAKNLIAHGMTARIYKVTRSADVDVIEDVGSASLSRSGKGIAIHIDVGMPLLPSLYASKAQVEDVYKGFRTAAMVSAPADRPLSREEGKSARRDVINDGLHRGFAEVRA